MYTLFEETIPFVIEFLGGWYMDDGSSNTVFNFKVAVKNSSIFTHVAANITLGNFLVKITVIFIF